MREHIETRVFRAISKNVGFVSLQSNEKLFLEFVKIEEWLWASTTHSEFAERYLLLSLLKKWKGFKPEIDPRTAGMSAWLQAEQQCYRTNRRLSSLNSPITDSFIDVFIRKIRKHIINMLGYDPREDWKPLCDWPTGATADTAMDTLVHEKVLNKTSATGSAVKHLYGCYELGFSILRGNRLEFVPKTYKVHRPIACEPTVNAFLQKGVGRLIRQRLKSRVNFDLDTQATINRENCLLAQSCSLSTIDLEAASDTLCLSLVRLVMPDPWYELLYQLRSPYTFIRKEGRTILLEKFSSMGNGFTFELETVIFRAICLAAYDMHDRPADNLCNFGDDIICDRDVFDTITSALSFFGFIVNNEKTFKEGRFFESCGKHYFDQMDCTPVYCKDVVRSVPDLIILYNKLFRWAQRTGLKSVVSSSLRLIVNELKNKLKGDLPYQPSFLDGDMGLLTTEERGWNYDEHGDVIMHRALVKVPLTASILEQPFYYKNWLRCGNSFYSTDSGRLERGFGERWRIQRKLKRWRSSVSSVT